MKEPKILNLLSRDHIYIYNLLKVMNGARLPGNLYLRGVEILSIQTEAFVNVNTLEFFVIENMFSKRGYEIISLQY